MIVLGTVVVPAAGRKAGVCGYAFRTYVYLNGRAGIDGFGRFTGEAKG
jgi:hypothetical protein